MSRIFTLTLNPALDFHQFIENPQLGQLNRAESSYYGASGKGLNVSKALASFGQTSVAIVPLGGLIGSMMQALLGMHIGEFESEVLPIKAQTRCNLKINDTLTGTLSEFNDSSPVLTEEEFAGCRKLLLAKVRAGDVVVLAGSLPAGVKQEAYAEFTTLLRERDVLVALDASGEALRHGINAQPWLVKPNAEELAEWLGTPLTTLEDVLAGARELQKLVPRVVVTLGAQGALLVNDERCLLAVPPSVRVKSTNGCGDAVMAGLIYGTNRGWDDEHLMRFATAIAVSRAVSDGRNFVDGSLIDAYLPKVTIIEQNALELSAGVK